MSQTKLRTQKRRKTNLERQNSHTRAQSHKGAHVPPARAACACSNQAELRTREPRKPNLERKKTYPRAQPHQGAHVPPARAACACSEKAELRTQILRKPNLERQNPHPRALIPQRRTRASHVLRALAPTKPNLERGNVASAYFKSRLNTFSTPIVESGPCPGIITVSFDIMRSFERIPLRRVFLA